jgi:hypothetical protein
MVLDSNSDKFPILEAFKPPLGDPFDMTGRILFWEKGSKFLLLSSTNAQNWL